MRRELTATRAQASGRPPRRSARTARPRWLIASFSSSVELGHRAAVRLAVGHEHRVVAEPAAARAARRPCGRAQSPTKTRSIAGCRDRRRRARRRSAAALPAGASRDQLARGSPRRSASSPAKRAERTPGAPPSAVGLDPRVVGDRRPPGRGRRRARLRQRVVGERLAVLGRQLDVVGQRLDRDPGRRRAAAANSRSLCALRVARTSDAGATASAQRLRLRPPRPAARAARRSRPPRARAARRDGRATAACARPSPAPRRARRRRSSRRWRRPRRSSPRGSRGRAAARRRRSRTRSRRPCRSAASARAAPSATSRSQASAQRDHAAGDRGAAGAAVGLEHVAVEVDGALAERLEVDDAAQRAADQPLDLDRAPVGRGPC